MSIDNCFTLENVIDNILIENTENTIIEITPETYAITRDKTCKNEMTLNHDQVKLFRNEKDTKREQKPEINYENYINKAVVFKSYKIPELKDAAKKMGLHISGTKQILIDRIEETFIKSKYVRIIQRVFRGYIVRQSFKLRGPGLKDRTKCVNDTDFITMEPLIEIEVENFYSYIDSKKFIYGFNILSLIQMNEKRSHNENIINPYNREKMDNEIISNIITLFKLTSIIYPEFKDANMKHNPRSNTRNNYARTRTRYYSRNSNNNAPNNTHNSNYINQSNQLLPITEYVETLNEILEMRTTPLNNRIQNLFIKIDQLGNYTQSSWFTNLTLRQCIVLYREFYDLWNFRGQITRELKLQICPYFGVFEGVFSRNIHANELTLEQIQTACVTVFENVVFAGINEEHKKIGAFHALSALTLVSTDARNALPWLYESVSYY